LILKSSRNSPPPEGSVKKAPAAKAGSVEERYDDFGRLKKKYRGTGISSTHTA